MFKLKMRVNFYDCDPAGILFFANLAQFAHNGYEQMMEHFNLSRDYFNDEKFVLPIISSESKFYKPLKAGDRIELLVYTSQIKDSSFELKYSFMLNNSLMAEVKTVHVCVLKEEFKKTELPEELRKALDSIG